ncbi:PREDICTED: calpain-9-like [Priapulus caudatus]|uniref:Calpain-9-like n=1 Tax=Priapulus caudatus TaxID=37621 RepID=A0ABM1E5F0_PRICU|nr:PREDICTED: calpain-9-like [Priapulus caudatus]
MSYSYNYEMKSGPGGQTINLPADMPEDLRKMMENMLKQGGGMAGKTITIGKGPAPASGGHSHGHDHGGHGHSHGGHDSGGGDHHHHAPAAPKRAAKKPPLSKKGPTGPKRGEPGSKEKPHRVSTCGNKCQGREKSSVIGDEDYEDIQEKMVAAGRLFKDHDFDAVDSTLFYSQSPPRHIEWKRPHEICANPKLFVEGASRFDVKQGELGDCWLLAAIASLTLNQNLLHRIVPDGQSFKPEEYCGAFRFRFWQYGSWVEIVVDDRLPTANGRLVFMHSADHNEFWTALLEKAYAKLNGSYESLKGGSTCEAMEDFTGGLTEMYELDKSPPANLFRIMKKALERGSLMGCSIEADPRVLEAELANGLIRGHAYSITSCTDANIETPRMKGKMQLVRVRNPWGNEAEWKGAWGDQSREWQLLNAEEKQRIGLVFSDDGEFWMSWKDFIANFQKLEICNLSPDALEDDPSATKRWEMNVHEGAWTRGCTAGGCRNYIETFANNPQYRITLTDPDEEDDDELCTCVIAVLQKGRRQKRREGEDLLTVGYSIYKLKDDDAETHDPMDKQFFMYNASVARAPNFINLREISNRFKLPPGTYIVIPSTFEPNELGEFVVRIFSEQPIDDEELDEETGIDETIQAKQVRAVHAAAPAQASAASREPEANEFFRRIAGDDMEVDQHELQAVLNHVLKKEFNFEGFSLECCRSMVAMMDDDRSGKLGLDEFRELWQNIRWWKNVFRDYDKDKSGNLNTFELRQALHSAGYRLSTMVLKVLVLRYGNKSNSMNFDEFVMCAVKLKSMIEKFQKLQMSEIDMNDWVELTMYT